MVYLVRTPWWLKKLYGDCTWNIKTTEKELYLTFDDGPHPMATPFVLDQLQRYHARATFFCIGKNVQEHLNIYRQMIDAGHMPGNHTYDHLNGWKEKDKHYLDNIFEAKKIIGSDLFRPPYGRITKFQLEQLKGEKFKLSTIMWSVLSGDFDANVTPGRCYSNVISNAGPGSIIVFHDSEKCFLKLKTVLPKVLEYFSKEGYVFRAISKGTNIDQIK